MTGHDVVVVGGRVAGAATAMLLARAGLKVALLDRAAYGSDTVSTHALMRGGVLQLARWGLLDRVVAAGTPAVRHTTFHYPDADPVEVSIRQSPGVDALYAPRRHLLDRILVDAAAEAGVEVHHRAAVTGLERDSRGRVAGVRVTGMRAAGVRAAGSGGELRLRARVTVGADGLRSVVARDAGAAVVQQGRTASAVLYRYHEDLPATGYEWAYGHGAGAGLIPTNDGRTCVFVSSTPGRLRALRRDGPEQAFRRLLRQAAPALVARVADAGPADRMHGWAGTPGFVRRSWGPGWALVGDAGYFKDPISTHGITDALRDAELLADAVAASLGGARAVPYESTRDRLSARLLEATEEIAGYRWDTHRVQELTRLVSSAMSDEVDHLQALPDRAFRTASDGFRRTDSVPART